MFIIAKLRHLRISPRKVRLVANLIKGMNVIEAEKQLKFLPKRAARPILKLLNSAIANAQHNDNLAKENLRVAKIIVEAGPVLKRWRARAMGRTGQILKRTSHIIISLESSESSTSSKEKPKKEISSETDVSKEASAELDSQPIGEIGEIEEQESEIKPKFVDKPKPYSTTSQSKKKFFSRQTFGNVKKTFRRKSI